MIVNVQVKFILDSFTFVNVSVVFVTCAADETGTNVVPAIGVNFNHACSHAGDIYLVVSVQVITSASVALSTNHIAVSLAIIDLFTLPVQSLYRTILSLAVGFVSSFDNQFISTLGDTGAGAEVVPVNHNTCPLVQNSSRVSTQDQSVYNNLCGVSPVLVPPLVDSLVSIASFISFRKA